MKSGGRCDNILVSKEKIAEIIPPYLILGIPLISMVLITSVAIYTEYFK